jgi:hypothetical protein
MLSNDAVKVNFWMISWRFLSAMSLVTTPTKQSYNGDALAMSLKFLSRGPMVEIVKTSIFSKMGVATCVVAKQHAYECAQSLFTSYKVPLEVDLI